MFWTGRDISFSYSMIILCPFIWGIIALRCLIVSKNSQFAQFCTWSYIVLPIRIKCHNFVCIYIAWSQVVYNTAYIAGILWCKALLFMQPLSVVDSTGFKQLIGTLQSLPQPFFTNTVVSVVELFSSSKLINCYLCSIVVQQWIFNQPNIVQKATSAC